MFAAKVLAFSALIAVAFAECPGDGTPCSGHGSCGAFDKCQCYRNWQGPHCADRTCPYQTSWNSIVEVDATSTLLTVGKGYEHGYTECSSKGDCNRKTGVCECFDGFTGSACRRMTCEGDNNCNGRGTCVTLKTGSSSYTGWDAEKIQVCECDPGYEGVACEKRMCPYGDDPITTSTFETTQFKTQGNDVQTITIGTAAAADTEYINLRYTDYRREKWTTYRISAYTPTAIEIKEALEALPNHAIPSVTVTGSVDASTHLGTFSVTFDNPSNSGKQPLLEVLKGGCELSGCQPLYKGSAALVATVAHASLASTATYEEFISCSQRGTCDTETGDCVCFKGYTGQACETQTIIV